MTPVLSAPLLALGLVFQSSPHSGAAAPAGSSANGGVRTGGAASGANAKKRGHDLADILLPLAGSARQSGSSEPPSPPDGDDVQVSSPSTKRQWRPKIAVDPTDRRHLVATAIDLRNDRRLQHDSNAAYYASFDGGATWSEFLEHHTAPPQSTLDSDVAFGPGGTTWLLRSMQNGPGGAELGVSSDGGVTEPTWTKTAADGADPVLAIDSTAGPYSGRIYVASNAGKWDGGPQWAIEVAISEDGGKNWAQHFVNDGGFAFRRLASCSIALDSNGGVFVVYYAADDGKMRIDTSSDGGATWTGDVDIADAAMYDVPNLRVSNFPYPRLAIDTSGGRYDGTLYVVWTQGASGGPDVVFSRSTDHGATWSAPVPASDATTNSQFAPAVTVDAEGTVDFGFCDCRDDPANSSIRCYVSRSSDGGTTLRPNVSASDVGFVPTGDDKAAAIDGSGIAASDRRIHSLWADERHGDYDIFTSSANLDLFTDVASISAATGGTASFTVDPGPLFQFAEYHVLGSLSGTTPGTDFYFENVPINYDLFTLATIYEANGPIFPGFTGSLDATGAATAQLVSGPLPPALIGVQMDFAALVRVGGGVHWGSAPTQVEIGN